MEASHCDISSVIRTKTIDRIISPMTVQLCHLIISMECDGDKYTGISTELVSIAEDLSKAMEYFVNTTTRVCAEYGNHFLTQELDQVSKAVLMSGKNMLLSIQKLNIQPTIMKHQEEFICSAQSILMGTLKILQLEDDAEVRKILQATDWFLDCLKFLQTAEDISQLLTSFLEFSEALILVNSLTERRILDLKDSTDQQKLTETLQVLRKCVPMLYTATHSNIKHPQNEQMNASKGYIFDLTAKTIHDLTFLLTNKATTQEHVKKRATVFQQIYNLLEILPNFKPTELENNDLDFLVGAIIFYSMSVADGSRPAIKMKLVKHCQHLLGCRKSLTDNLKKFSEKSSLKQTQSEVQQKCTLMKVELGNLNQVLLSAIFYQILDTFSNANDPLKRLLKAALKTHKTTASHPSKSIQPFFQAFQNHAEQLLNVATLVLAKCPENRTIDEIQGSADCLVRIRDAVIALLFDISIARSKSKFLENAQSLYQRWVQATESLLVSFDSLVTIHDFFDLFIKEFEENRQSCERLLKSQEPETFHHKAVDLCGLTEHVVQVVNRYIDQSRDPIFRNGLRVLVRQLENTLYETKTAAINCVEDISCVTSQKLFLETTKHLFNALYNVRDGAKGYRHPDLLSPLRDEVHPVHSKPKMIELNQLDITINHRELSKYSLSHERYLIKPLPCSSSAKISDHFVKPNMSSTFNKANLLKLQESEHGTVNMVDSWRGDAHILNTFPDLDRAVVELMTAISNHNYKEISIHCSSLLEITNICIEAAKESIHLAAMAESDILLEYKDLETLTAYLALFSRKKGTSSVLNMDKLTQTAVLLSSRIKEMKKHLQSWAGYWNSFSYHLFCGSARTDVVSNTQIFNKTMQRLAAIVHLMSASSNTSDSDQEAARFSVNQQLIVKIHIILSKSQIAANHVLTKAISHSLHSDQVKLEYMCILWSVITQQLLKSIDEFLDIDIPDSTDLIVPSNIGCKNDTLICETALWIQEAAVLSIPNDSKEKAQNMIKLLKEEIAQLRDAISKLRDSNQRTSRLSSVLTVNWVLLHRELAVKMESLVYHLKHVYAGTPDVMQTMVNFVVSAANKLPNSNIVIQKAFEEHVLLLVEKINLAKEILEDALLSKKQEDLIFMVDHLSIFTSAVVARARALLENKRKGDVFILDAMSLKWSAKAHRFISQLQANEEIDGTTLKAIKQCLEVNKTPDMQITNEPMSLISGKQSSESIGSIDINVSVPQTAMENKQRASSEKEQTTTNRLNKVAAYDQNASCAEKLSGIKDDKLINVDEENKSTARQQMEAEKKLQREINAQKAALRESKKKLNHEQCNRANKQKHNYFIKTLLDTLNEEEEDTTNERMQEVRNREWHVSSKQEIEEPPNEEQQELPDEKLQMTSILDCNELVLNTSNMVVDVNPQETAREEQQVMSSKRKRIAVDMHNPNSTYKKEVPSKEHLESVHNVTEMEVNAHLQENSEKSQVTCGEERVKHSKIDMPESACRNTQRMASNEQQQTSTYKTAKMTNNVNMQESRDNSQVIFSYEEEHKITTNMDKSTLVGKNQEVHSLEWLESEYKVTNMEVNVSLQGTDNENPQVMTREEEKKISNQIAKPKSEFKKPRDKMEHHDSTYKVTKMGVNVNIQGRVGDKPYIPSKEEEIKTSTKRHQPKYVIPQGGLTEKSLEAAHDITKITSNGIVQETVSEIGEKLHFSTNQENEYIRTNIEKPLSTYKKQQTLHKKESLEAAKVGIKDNLQEINIEKPQVIVCEEEEKITTNVEHQKKTSSAPHRDVPSSGQIYSLVRCPLSEVVEEWEGESNAVVQVTREMAIQMSYMTQYLNKKGPIQTTDQLIASAKHIAEHGQTFVEFVRVMARSCMDERSLAELLCGTEQIHTISNQLRIISSVKAATGCDDSAGEDVLVKNAQNLIRKVLQTWKAAEVACIKGPGKPAYSEEEAEVAIFLTQWRKKLLCSRRKEVSCYNE